MTFLIDTLYEWWTVIRASKSSPFRMNVSSLFSYLRNEKIPVADRKQFWYHVQSYYMDQVHDKDLIFLQRLIHTSDHAKTTFYSYYCNEDIV